MCGIAGIHGYGRIAPNIDRAELIAMSDHMQRRGPDGSGLWIADDQRTGFVHRRLAIIDLSDGGQQPMQTRDGRLTISFNGEIYNYRELRSALHSVGYHFQTESDTEVLLHLYAHRGIAMMGDLRGMFAFALWDADRRAMMLARDPYGIKPLYYSDNGQSCRFASQVKTLLATGAVAKDLDPAGQVGFYLFGSVPEPFTTWRAIRSVPSGSTIVVDHSGAGVPQSFHSIAQIYCSAETQTVAGGDLQSAVSEALCDSVRSHLVADVPVGAFLSSGVDSSALVGLMRDAGAADITTVTIGFEEFRGLPQDETVIAEDIAWLYGTRHTRRIVTRAEFEGDLPKIMAAMDQPSIDGVNTWFAAKAACELGLKVAISGLGGDELFGGYPSFRTMPRMVRAMALPSRLPLPHDLLRNVATYAGQRLGAHPKAAGLLQYGGSYAGAYLLQRGLFMPWELDGLLDREIVAQGLEQLQPLSLVHSMLKPLPSTPFARIATLESSLYMRNQLLRDTDWASMAHSLEVRTPLVDSVLLDRLARLAVGALGEGGKRLLALAPSRPVPTTVTNRTKTGFTTPVGSWMADRVRAGARPSSARRGAIISSGTQPWARGWSRVVAVAAQAGL
ncbi:MAG TPA: asparagine synthase (glutamine-hydrolyzing) [Xanthobacteraceae bacterium]|jgi:asparagine synthase (glutamine-hydrolysing)|nr:asparagine synthase (glutamine-hydrolyzing) [Xanthobacteraceae bacterium]